jgi:hypothetical protein
VAAKAYPWAPQAAWQRRLLCNPIKFGSCGISERASKRSKHPSTCPSPMPSSCNLLLVDDVLFESAATPHRKDPDNTHPKISRAQNVVSRHHRTSVIHEQGAPVASARPSRSRSEVGEDAGRAGDRAWRGPCGICMCRGQRLDSTDRCANNQFHHLIMEPAFCDACRTATGMPPTSAAAGGAKREESDFGPCDQVFRPQRLLQQLLDASNKTHRDTGARGWERLESIATTLPQIHGSERRTSFQNGSASVLSCEPDSAPFYSTQRLYYVKPLLQPKAKPFKILVPKSVRVGRNRNVANLPPPSL